MSDILLRSLNPYQREAVKHFEGPLLVLAGVGSGKTRVITHRIAYLMAKYGVPLANILGVTFTNKAAEEMKNRVERLIGPSRSDNVPWIKTFHATCARILRNHIHLLSPNYDGNFSILNAQDAREVIASAMKELEIPTDQFSPQLIASIIDRAKDELISPEEFLARRSGMMDDFLLELAYNIYKRYQRTLERSNALDFSDLLLLTVKLFQEKLEILNYYRDQFKFILIDEYQDTNYAQYIFSQLLAEKYENICVVGDDDQSIYGWRSADPYFLLKFEEDFPNAKVVKLKTSYRSTKKILRAAQFVIKNNPLRKEKELRTVKEEGDPIYLYLATDEVDEAVSVAEEIERVWKVEGIKLGDIAILYRVNTLSRAVEEALLLRGIPYEVVRGLRFYERMEVRDVISYLRFILNQDDLSLLRILNRPKRGIGKRTVTALQDYALRKGISLWEGIVQMVQDDSPLNSGAKDRIGEFKKLIEDFREREREASPSELAQYILKRTRYLDYLEEEGEGFEDRVGNIKELLGQIREFEMRSLGGIREFLEEIALVSDADGYSEEEGRVTLMTLHAAKGLEFNRVFIVGMEENLLPHSRSIKEGTADEERRLCYVGMTRAKEALYLSYAAQRSLYGGVMFNPPSRFISEMSHDDLESFSPSFGKICKRGLSLCIL